MYHSSGLPAKSNLRFVFNRYGDSYRPLPGLYLMGILVRPEPGVSRTRCMPRRRDAGLIYSSGPIIRQSMFSAVPFSVSSVKIKAPDANILGAVTVALISKRRLNRFLKGIDFIIDKVDLMHLVVSSTTISVVRSPLTK